MLIFDKLREIDKLEIIKYCNKNIEILHTIKQKINNKLLNLLASGVINYEIYDKIINLRLLHLKETIRENYEPILAQELWNYASRSLVSINIRLYEFRLAKKFAVSYLARQQFYRQNGLPVELNLMIEAEIEEQESPLVEQIIFYSLEKAGLIGPMGERDVWYYGQDFRLKNDAPEELRKAISDFILVRCRGSVRGQHNTDPNSRYFSKEYISHLSCLNSPWKLKLFANKMLEIIEKVASQRNLTQPEIINQGQNLETENRETQAESQLDSVQPMITEQEGLPEQDNLLQLIQDEDIDLIAETYLTDTPIQQAVLATESTRVEVTTQLEDLVNTDAQINLEETPRQRQVELEHEARVEETEWQIINVSDFGTYHPVATTTNSEPQTETSTQNTNSSAPNYNSSNSVLNNGSDRAANTSSNNFDYSSKNSVSTHFFSDSTEPISRKNSDALGDSLSSSFSSKQGDSSFSRTGGSDYSRQLTSGEDGNRGNSQVNISVSENKNPHASSIKIQETETKPESEITTELIEEVKTKNSEGKDWTPKEKEIIEDILTENVVVVEEKGQKPAKITTVEQIKLVQEIVTKISQAQRSQTFSPELNRWLIEKKESNFQVYQIINARHQQFEKTLKHLEQLKIKQIQTQNVLVKRKWSAEQKVVLGIVIIGKVIVISLIMKKIINNYKNKK